jgi:hypothetical protein
MLDKPAHPCNRSSATKHGAASCKKMSRHAATTKEWIEEC